MDVTYKLEENNIKYSGRKDMLFPLYEKVTLKPYKYDEEGNIISHNPVINAIDIDWQNAEVPGLNKKISSTTDLLTEISNIATKIPDSSTASSPYIKDGYWYINGVNTGVLATGQNGLTPYIKDGGWWIGETRICDIASNNFSPYIGSDGYWYINGVNTGVKAEGEAGTSGNTPYVGENGNWWIGNTDLKISAQGNAGADGNTPYIGDDGYWYIGTTNTGVKASSTNVITNNYYPFEGPNGNWWIKTPDGDVDTGVPVRSQIIQGVSDGIPIYDSEMVEERQNKGSLPDKYISVDTSYNLPSNVTLINFLVSTVNSLQQEVTKLKNTFTRGIYSYNNEATYMSSVVNNYGDIDSEEPLWAIDESDLTEIEDFEFNIEALQTFIDDGTLKSCKGQRMFAYITGESPNVEVILKDKDSESRLSFNFSDYINCRKCNIMLIISRLPEDKAYPANYIYFVISDYTSNTTLLHGYLNESLELVNSQADLSKRYYIYSVDMSNANPSKFNVYMDDKALGSEVIPIIPDEDETSYRVAHIAIRSCKNYKVISSIANQLVNNELIFDESTNKLYIKTNNKIINIGASGGGVEPDPEPDVEDIMTKQEIIKALEAQGIINISYVNSALTETEDKYNPSNIESYSLNDIGSIRFTHEETGKVYEFKTNAYGELESKLIEDSSTFAQRLNGASIKDDYKSVRGLIGQLGEYEYYKKYGSQLAAKDDHGLYADRIRIGAVYAPLTTDVTFGCSHAYVELENTSDKDFNLTGCLLHFIKPEYSVNLQKTIYIKKSLPLTGILPAGSTYLIRGKKYIENDNDSNCYIHVNSYDQEWYDNGELIDFTMNKNEPSYTFILSYHGNIGSLPLLRDKEYNEQGVITYNGDNFYKLGIDLTDEESYEYLGDTISGGNQGTLLICRVNDGKADDTAKKNSPLTYPKGFIDAIEIGNTARYTDSITIGSDTYAISTFNYTDNCLYKGTYELDPAKQAFNGFTMRDSSRSRWTKKANDYQYITLKTEYIEFPKSDTIRYVGNFTPKASYEHKNVITDKTTLNYDKPNAVSVSYGANAYTTRCFNWVSAANLDEYVWIYDSSNNSLGKFESYKTTVSPTQSTSYPRRKEFPKTVKDIVYCDYRENQIIDRGPNGLLYEDVTYAKYAKAPRCCGLLAGSDDFFVSHKCIVELRADAVTEKTQYSYIVGQSDKNGLPLEKHCSERRYFTLYPETYKPVIYQITDQQGFHWVEYQVWAAAAIELNKKIMADELAAEQAGTPIMPIIINTGDATQSGSRINEWLDYYIAGDPLFSHYEQVNIVGNNDLNGTNIQALGTGDDPGKSNPYYYYVFNCNEVNNFFGGDEDPHYPIVNNTYVPSFYYIDFNSLRIVLMNSEITVINCRDWYNLRVPLTYGTSTAEYTVNIYTGFSLRGITSNVERYVANDIEGFTPLYTLLWHALNKAENGNKKCIIACHEMPYTVVTQACCKEINSDNVNQINRFRSISDAATGKLIGSHLNQIDATEDGAGVYWFSRLLEFMNVKLCIGGHKHTYAITYPVRENYKYYDGDELKTSKYDGPMNMPDSLMNEERVLNVSGEYESKVIWSWKPTISGENGRDEYQWYKNDQNDPTNNYGDGDNEKINWSKLPLAYRINNVIVNQPVNLTFYPVTALYEDDGFMNNAVTYIMSQATGYKLTSNKELPTPNQKFSRIVPETKNSEDAGDTPNNNQKYPMYVKYDISADKTTCKVFLGRILNIFKNYKFSKVDYNTGTIGWNYLIDKTLHVSSDSIAKLDEYGKNELVSYETHETGYYDDKYDNYGLWVIGENGKERQMIETIVL